MLFSHLERLVSKGVVRSREVDKWTEYLVRDVVVVVESKRLYFEATQGPRNANKAPCVACGDYVKIAPSELKRGKEPRCEKHPAPERNVNKPRCEVCGAASIVPPSKLKQGHRPRCKAHKKLRGEINPVAKWRQDNGMDPVTGKKVAS